MSKSKKNIRLEYVRGDKKGEVIVITHRPGEESVRTIVKTFPPGTVRQTATSKPAVRNEAPSEAISK